MQYRLFKKIKIGGNNTVKRMSKKAVFALAMALFLAFGAVGVSSMGSEQSWSVTLPALRTGIDVKSSYSAGDTSAKVSLDYIGNGYDSVWVKFRARPDSSWQDVTDDNRIVYVGDSLTIPLNKTVSSGTYMMLVVGNNNISYVNVNADGTVNFP